MKLNSAPARCRWKPVSLCLLLALALPAAKLARAEPTDPEGLRQEAVSQYIEGATRELEAFGQKISAAARPDNQQECSEAKAKLDECTGLVTELKNADPGHFDQVKARYERTRVELVKAVQAAQRK